MITLLYRLVLRLYPKEFRDRFGRELVETAGNLDHSSNRHPMRALVDAFRTALAIRFDLRSERALATGGPFRLTQAPFLADLRLAARSLWRSPGFAAAAVLTLGLGIAAHTVVYAVVDAMLIRPLPFGDRADRLVTLHSTHPTQARDWNNSEISYADLMDVREGTATFDAVEGVITRNFSLSTEDDAARAAGASVTPGLFPLLGVTPIEGRLFQPEEAAEPGFETVVILSHALWQRLFDGDRNAVGKTVLINARPLTIIGVMPEGFGFPERQQLWVPYGSDRTTGRASRGVLAVGLLKPGVSVGQARVDADRVAATLASTYPDTNRDWGLAVLPMRQLFVGSSQTGLTIMLVAVTLLLLVACANVAGLLIARGTARERELVTRAALGASRGRLVRLLLGESVMLAAIGGALGVLLAMWGLQALMASMAELPPYWAQPQIDARVLSLTALVTALVAIVSGLAPAWRLSRVNLAGASSSATRSAGPDRGHRRFQSGLVVTQVAMSLVLLMAGTLLARTAVALQRADPGFDTAPIFSARFYIAGDNYDDAQARGTVVQEVVAELERLPGVSSAVVTGSIPADDGGDSGRIRPAGVLAQSTDDIGVQLIPTTAGLWSTLGLSLVEGRTFWSEEGRNPLADVVIINQRLAKLFWPSSSALGHTIQVVDNDRTVGLRVVGIAPDLVYEEFGETTPQSELNLYLPYATLGWRTLAVLLRTTGPSADVAPVVPGAIRRVDPVFATFDSMTMTERRAVTTQGERLLAETFSAFALVAVALACVGIYGLLSYSASQRRREVGVRLAIGATRLDILRLFLNSGARLGVIGIVIGLPMAVVVVQALAALLFAVSPWDAASWLQLPMVLLAAVLLASLVPARRACRVDAADALRD